MSAHEVCWNTSAFESSFASSRSNCDQSYHKVQWDFTILCHVSFMKYSTFSHFYQFLNFILFFLFSVEGAEQKQTACYDIDVEVDDTLKTQMNNFLLSTTSQQEIQVGVSYRNCFIYNFLWYFLFLSFFFHIHVLVLNVLCAPVTMYSMHFLCLIPEPGQQNSWNSGINQYPEDEQGIFLELCQGSTTIYQQVANITDTRFEGNFLNVWILYHGFLLIEI